MKQANITFKPIYRVARTINIDFLTGKLRYYADGRLLAQAWVQVSYHNIGSVMNCEMWLDSEEIEFTAERFEEVWCSSRGQPGQARIVAATALGSREEPWWHVLLPTSWRKDGK